MQRYLWNELLVSIVAIDSSGNKWIGSDAVGPDLFKFNDTTWTKYDMWNSGLPSRSITTICVDRIGNKWFGTVKKGFATDEKGVVKYDDTNWTVYNPTNSPLPTDTITVITVDNLGIKWIGTQNGLAAFDDTHWCIYNYSNSGLPGNHITTIAIDKDNNKWIGTANRGICVFRGDMTVNLKHSNQKSKELIKIHNYPNPFTSQTFIQYKLAKRSKVTLNIYNIKGKLLKTIVNKKQPGGSYTAKWNGLDEMGNQLPSGVYCLVLTSENENNFKRVVKNICLLK